MFAAIKAIRSLAAQYNLQTNIQATILSTSPNEFEMLLSQAPTIVTLSKGCKSANVVADASGVPAGCGSIVIGPTATVHVLVKVSEHLMGYLLS